MTPVWCLENGDLAKWHLVQFRGVNSSMVLEIVTYCKQDHIPGKFYWNFLVDGKGTNTLDGVVWCELGEAAVMVALRGTQGIR